MSRLRWPDSTNSVSDDPGTVQIMANGQWATVTKLHVAVRPHPMIVAAILRTVPGFRTAGPEENGSDGPLRAVSSSSSQMDTF